MSEVAARGRYDRIAGVYDALGWIYSGGAMGRLRRAQTARFGHGERVLYAGAGTGHEAPAAVSAGARVTLLDASSGMLRHCERRLGPLCAEVQLCHEDIFAHQPEQPYDLVVANFFLNVFSERSLPQVMHKLAALLRGGGRLAVGDFAAPSEAVLHRWLQQAYYLPPLVLFRLLTHNAWHPLYDYRPVALEAGLTLGATDRVRIFRIGPSWLQTLWFDKP